MARERGAGPMRLASNANMWRETKEMNKSKRGEQEIWRHPSWNISESVDTELGQSSEDGESEASSGSEQCETQEKVDIKEVRWEKAAMRKKEREEQKGRTVERKVAGEGVKGKYRKNMKKWVEWNLCKNKLQTKGKLQKSS
jgi:hypothetical protein